MEGTLTRSLIFPELHWLIYITKICHWKNIHILNPNQTCLKDWRGISQQGTECLFDWSVNFFCTKILCMVWPTLINVLFWICRIFIWWGSRQRKTVPCWLDFQPLRFYSQESIKFFLSIPFTALAPRSSRWEAQSKCLAFHRVLSEPTPILELLKVLVRIVTEVNIQVAVFCLVFLFFSQEGTINPPSLPLHWWKGNKCMNEECRLWELFRWVCSQRREAYGKEQEWTMADWV